MGPIKKRYFELWGDEIAQNHILKYLLLVLGGLLAVESVSLGILALRKPTIIAVGSLESKILTFSPPKPELLREELTRFVKSYVSIRYTFNSADIDSRIADAKKLISADFQKQFDTANTEQIKIIKEKKISQSVYFSKEPEINSEKLTATIFMDRIFTVDGMRATAPLTLQIQFQYGPRISENPEGIYITGETLQAEQVAK